MINIFLAEDHLLVRRGIRMLLDSQANMRVIGEADNGEVVLEKLAQGIIPDILITDITMPEMDGLELANILSKEYPSIKIIALSMLDSSLDMTKAFDKGVKGYLLKNVGYDELLFAVKYVYQGGMYMCEELVFMLLEKVRKQPDLNYISEETVKEFDLSERELEVLQLIGEGYTNLEIADKLFLSKRTIEGHRQSLIDKTQAKNSASLIKFAVKHGIIV